MSLKSMCKVLNLSRRSIQCYEKAGLMMPTDKNKYGHLLYDESTLHRAGMIKFFQQVGFKLREIKEIIDAPNEVIREEFIKRVNELEIEEAKLAQIITDAKEYIKSIE